MKVKVNLPLEKRAGSRKRVILIIKCKDVREKDANRKANIRKKKNVPTTCQWCQRRANGANDVPTVPFLHIQKFGTKFSIVGAN
jgi:hypothetical protein